MGVLMDPQVLSGKHKGAYIRLEKYTKLSGLGSNPPPPPPFFESKRSSNSTVHL